MRIRTLVVACVWAVAIAEPVGAQDKLCSTLAEMVQLAPSKFASVRGVQEKGHPYSYAAKRILPGASTCKVTREEKYVCTWEVPIERVNAMFQAMRKTLRSCYPRAPFHPQPDQAIFELPGAMLLLLGEDDGVYVVVEPR